MSALPQGCFGRGGVVIFRGSRVSAAGVLATVLVGILLSAGISLHFSDIFIITN